MTRMLALIVLTAAFGLMTLVGPAQAQAARTWVSGVGDDANPCSRTAPCRTFAGAFGKTATGGQIDCLDPGAFGALSISHSITIECSHGGGFGSVQVSRSNGISVNAGTGVVILRGLDIDGLLQTSAPGLVGIQLTAAQILIIDDCFIHGFSQWGINLTAGATTSVLVSNTALYNNGSDTPASGGIQAGLSAAANILVQLNRVRAFGNLGNGIRGEGQNGSGGVVNVSVRNSVSAGNSVNGVVASTPSGGATVIMTVDASVAAYNASSGTFGVISDGSGSIVRIGNSTITGNATGVGTSNSGTLQSFKNNQIGGNATDGTPVTAFPGPNNQPLQ